MPRLGTAIAILGREIEFAKATLERVADETAAASAVRASNNEEFTRAREDHQQARGRGTEQGCVILCIIALPYCCLFGMCG